MLCKIIHVFRTFPITSFSETGLILTGCQISSLSVQKLIHCPSSLSLGMLQTSCLLILELHLKQLKQRFATWGVRELDLAMCFPIFEW